jgi:hypothetical protein
MGFHIADGHHGRHRVDSGPLRTGSADSMRGRHSCSDRTLGERGRREAKLAVSVTYGLRKVHHARLETDCSDFV